MEWRIKLVDERPIAKPLYDCTRCPYRSLCSTCWRRPTQLTAAMHGHKETFRNSYTSCRILTPHPVTKLGRLTEDARMLLARELDEAMAAASREFQVFAKPVGPLCNLGCSYCYYLKRTHLYPSTQSFQMPPSILEEYIVQNIEASPGPVIRFSWHGGEATLLGLDYFRRIATLQRKHKPPNRSIINGIQTNGILLDEDWCRFFAAEGFTVGLSLDGPREMHDRYRLTKDGKPTHDQVMTGYRLLRRHQVPTDILCVVNSHNVQFPLRVYRFFKQIHAGYVNFLPLVEPCAEGGVSESSIAAEAWGRFLSTIFDEWRDRDIGKIKVHIFEEAARTAFNQEHLQCIFRPTCGNIPVVEHNGDFYSCDHYVDVEHRLGNIRETPLVNLIESPRQRAFGEAKLETLPQTCRECEVRAMCNGECPKNRILKAPDREPGLNYLCAGYKRFFTHCRPFVSALAAILSRLDASAR